MIFWFILILSSLGGISPSRQSQNNPIYDLNLDSHIHLKWQVDYDNEEVIFEVAFLGQNHGHFQGM